MNPADSQSNKPPRILCIGIPVRDLTFRIAQLPAPGSKEHASHFEEICGGNALNAAVGIVRLGGRAALTGPIGDAGESSHNYLFDQLASERIERDGLVHMPGLVTPVSTVMIDPGGERTIVTFRDPALWQVRLPDADQLLRDCDAVLIESRCAGFATGLCAEARRRGIAVVVDVDHAMSPTDGLLTAASHLIFSSEALQATAEIADDAEALTRIAALTPSFVAATKGPRGTIWLDRTTPRHTPAFAVQTVDTLGAGDIFHGAFSLAITERRNLPEALQFASAAAALKCTRFGGAFASPQRAEVERFLSEAGASPQAAG